MASMLDSFDASFVAVHQRSCALIQQTAIKDLFRKPRELDHSMAMFSVGEYVLRSGAAVEQTFLGLTRRLWDDPFEWTLPEKLSSPELVQTYLEEVETTRLSGFKFFTSDDDLLKRIPAPEALRTIFDLILVTIARAEHYQGRAFAVFQMLSDQKLPRY
jgi:hypothetical protein